MNKHIHIQRHQIGGDAPCFIIVEVAQAHNGSFELAMEYVDTIAETGVEAIKFQTHLAAYESSLDEPFRVSIDSQDKNRYEYWKRMEFSEDQWKRLAERCNEKGLIFLSSGFSVEAVELLARIGMPAWKIGSGEFKSFELLDAIARYQNPILFSTGMSRYCEIERAVIYFNSKELPYALLQCTSKYPTPLKNVGLNVIQELKRMYNCPVGLSDHSGTIYPGLAAIAQSADLLELHVILDRSHTGPDASSSLTPDQIRELVNARDAFYTMKKFQVDKDSMADELHIMRGLFSKSVAPVRVLEAGTILTPELLAPRKPGTGIPFSERDKVIGKKLKRSVSPLRVLQWDDIDE